MESLFPDHYAVLGVDRNADADTIKRFYRKTILAIHPDKTTDESQKEQRLEYFLKTQRAYETLSDKEKRRQYDAQVLKTSRIEAERRNTADKMDKKARRERFVAFALELFDEREGALIEGKHAAISTADGTAKVASDPIEERIKARNLAFEKLKSESQLHQTLSAEAEGATATSAKKNKTLYSVPVEQLNLQVMNPQQNEPLVDIVAVHGLGAIPDITWKERTSKMNWLSHETMLPSASPRARILRFGYDSLWMGKTPIRTSLSTIAYKLLLSLNMIRTNDLLRPLIFIGHCFGGLVIQRALNLAKMQPVAYPNIFNTTVGIVFLGTPHRGTRSFTQESALFAAIAASSDLSQNLETEVLDSMASDQGALLDVTDDFVILCTDGGPMITCFFEQRSSKLGKVIGRNDIDEFIVDQKSATLDGHRKYGLELDHFSLNKFDGPDNPNYIQVRAEILRFYQAALVKAQSLSKPTTHHLDQKTKVPIISKISKEVPPPSMPGVRLHHELANPNPKISNFQLNKTVSTRAPGSSQIPLHSVVGEDEADLRKEALKELKEEEAKKQILLHKEEMAVQQAKDKLTIEMKYLERLKRNMVKYGIENPDEILSAYPLPEDKDLSQQEIKEKENWHKNLMRRELTAAGLDGGQIDEILNDIGDLMVIDNVETTFTKMAKKWVSTRTLDKYGIPWQFDKDDDSSIIITRWVPDYERDFLWDHSQALRDNRGRKQHRHHDRVPKASKHAEKNSQTSAVEDKDWFARMMDAFKDAPKRNDFETNKYKNLAKDYISKKDHSREYKDHRSAYEDYAKAYEDRQKDFPAWRTVLRPQDSERSKNDRERKDRESGRPEIREWSPERAYTPRKSTPFTVRSSTATPPSYLRRTASQDSIQSAPDVTEVDRRRRTSRAMSRSREREPIARRSGEFSRRSSFDDRSRPPSRYAY